MSRRDTKRKNLNFPAWPLLRAKVKKLLHWKSRDWTRFTQSVVWVVWTICLTSINLMSLIHVLLVIQVQLSTCWVLNKAYRILFFTSPPRKHRKAKRVCRYLLWTKHSNKFSRMLNWSRCEPWWDNLHRKFRLWQNSRMTNKKRLPFFNSSSINKTDKTVALQCKILSRCSTKVPSLNGVDSVELLPLKFKANHLRRQRINSH